ncbi:class I SAM-dependent methyltransferase [Metabacillus bambusae]|uniref:Methyltransferase domain-containing protein n=1 Tax=Metabacillus bambusae TaxID=2795218 RepID=A0ABS3MWB2_9BACI|nr:class I SAM-dependent methyltransferase [Metabacillus bambusae]MBO1510315.1 methyltransferase domain-containing protein [Metabacillus bambusae]
MVIVNGHIRNNVNRFEGFGTLYDENRPIPPQDIVGIVKKYLRRQPQTVLDVGCGTGLSTFLWVNEADSIIGFEPNDDMRNVALAKLQVLDRPSNIQFLKGLSHQLKMPTESADVVTCSQSFHWMDPHSTLQEFSRVLRHGGVFAAYDCDWPPTFDWLIEEQYKQLISLTNEKLINLTEKDEQPYRWNKSEHLQKFRESNLFRFSKEIVFHHWEKCDATRYANIAFSNGGLQTALQLGADDLHEAVNDFKKQVKESFAGEMCDVLFSYRMRLAVK